MNGDAPLPEERKEAEAARPTGDEIVPVERPLLSWEAQEEDSSLAPITQASAVAGAQREVEAAVLLAQRFPRNEQKAYQLVVRACRRPSFAERGNYAFERGTKKDANGNWVPNVITGPSVYLAREIAKFWGHLRYGSVITFENEDERAIKGYAWDIEHNVYVESETRFRKLIQRKVWNPETKKKDKTEWVKPDERDLRELTNKHAAILVRNCILQLIPADVVEDASQRCRDTKLAAAKEDPDSQVKKILTAFDEMNVSAEDLERLLGHPLAKATPPEIVQLRDVFNGLREGHYTLAELFERRGVAEKAAEAAGTSKASIRLEDLKARPVGPAPGAAGAPPPEPQAEPKQVVPIDPDGPMPAEALVEFQGMVELKGIPAKEVEEFTMTQWGCESIAGLPAKAAAPLVAWIQAWKPKSRPKG